MPTPESSSQQALRYPSEASSISSSSVHTFKPETIKSPSLSDPSNKSLLVSGIVSEVTDQSGHSKRHVSHSSRRHAGSVSNKAAFTMNEEISAQDRWSQSTVSSISTARRDRRSSSTKRFSLGTSALHSIYGAAYRSPSPSKERRPTDTQYSPSGTGVLASSSAAKLRPVDPLSPLILPEKLHAASDQDGDKADAQESSFSSVPASSMRDFRAPEAVDWTTPSMPERRNSPLKQTLRYQTQGYTQGAVDSSPPRSAPIQTTSRRENDKKAMLSRALQRANDAVQLDSAQDYHEATEAYEEACGLLGHVMSKSSNEEDKRKLTTIVRIQPTHSVRANCLDYLASYLYY